VIHADGGPQAARSISVIGEELQQRTGEVFPEVPEFARSEKLEVSWIMVYLPYVVMVNPSRDS
jgi:hypothetical protein